MIMQPVSRFMLSKKIFAKSDIAFHQNLCWDKIWIYSFIDLNRVEFLTNSCVEKTKSQFQVWKSEPSLVSRSFDTWSRFWANLKLSHLEISCICLHVTTSPSIRRLRWLFEPSQGPPRMMLFQVTHLNESRELTLQPSGLNWQSIRMVAGHEWPRLVTMHHS